MHNHPDDIIDAEPSTVSLTRIAELLTAAGVDAFVHYTGGGCATIYAGPSHTELGYGPRYLLVAGPGTFTRDGTHPIGFGDFCFGADDDGATDVVRVTGGTEESIAADMLAWMQARVPTYAQMREAQFTVAAPPPVDVPSALAALYAAFPWLDTPRVSLTAENALMQMLHAWCEYADAYHAAGGLPTSRIGNDAALADPWLNIGRSLLAMIGEADHTSINTVLDATIREIAMTHADVDDQLESTLCDRCEREPKLPGEFTCLRCRDLVAGGAL